MNLLYALEKKERNKYIQILLVKLIINSHVISILNMYANNIKFIQKPYIIFFELNFIFTQTSKQGVMYRSYGNLYKQLLKFDKPEPFSKYSQSHTLKNYRVCVTRVNFC